MRFLCHRKMWFHAPNSPSSTGGLRSKGASVEEGRHYIVIVEQRQVQMFYVDTGDEGKDEEDVLLLPFLKFRMEI